MIAERTMRNKYLLVRCAAIVALLTMPSCSYVLLTEEQAKQRMIEGTVEAMQGLCARPEMTVETAEVEIDHVGKANDVDRIVYSLKAVVHFTNGGVARTHGLVSSDIYWGPKRVIRGMPDIIGISKSCGQ